MRLILTTLLVLVFTCLRSAAQQREAVLFTKDSIENQSPKWILVNGDKPEYASPVFDDRGLPEVATLSMKTATAGPSPFKGLGWLRLRFRVDTALAGKPLAFGLTQNGASELYLDGTKIYQRGLVGDAKKATYYDPRRYPVPLVISDTLTHLLAIRYANWNYNNGSYLYQDEDPGFSLQLREAQPAIDDYINHDNTTGIFCCIMFGVFLILSILHLLFFLYYRKERSNLWFSLFAGSLAVLLLLPYAGNTFTTPKLLLVMSYYSFFLSVATCFALSGLLNQLFSRSSLRFRIVSAFYLATCLLYIFVVDLQIYLIFAVITVAVLEAIVVIITAIIRRVPGARIIGAGLGLFILTLLFVVILAVANQQIHFKLSGIRGLILFAMLCLILLSIPISLSAYLAYKFSHVSRSLGQRLLEVEALSAKSRGQEEEKQRILEQQNEVLEREVSERTGEVLRQKGEIEHQHAALVEEKRKSDDLLLNILPAEVAEELKQNGSSVARHYEEVSVLFTDIVNFTSLAEQLDAQELVQELNECFTAFDTIIEKHGLQKIKTIGDAYMAVCGLPARDPRHAHNTVQAALEIRSLMLQKHRQRRPFEIRIGINSGPVVAGIIGVKKFAYDIWGDTVNMAARMEQHSEAGRINISGATYALVKDAFVCTPRGKVAAKNKGEVDMYFVEAEAVAISTLSA